MRYVIKKVNPDGSLGQELDFSGFRFQAIERVCDLKEKFGTDYLIIEIAEKTVYDTRLLNEKVEF